MCPYYLYNFTNLFLNYSLGENIRSNLCLDILSYLHDIAIPAKDLGSGLQELQLWFFVLLNTGLWTQCSALKCTLTQLPKWTLDLCVLSFKSKTHLLKTHKFIFRNKCNFGCVFWTEIESKVQCFWVQSPGLKSTNSSKPFSLACHDGHSTESAL